MSFSKPSNDADVREPVQVVYDAQCPLCTLYCEQAQQNIRLGSETDYGMTIELELVDARKDSLLLAEITRLGLDIDDGMVVKTGDSIHYGADAIHTLTGYSRKGGFLLLLVGCCSDQHSGLDGFTPGCAASETSFWLCLVGGE